MRNIKEGDRVEVYYNQTTNINYNRLIKGVVQNMPANTGDMIYLYNDTGETIAINPNSSSFEGLVRLEE